MAEIGNVSVKFTASTGGLKSGVADAARSLEAFGKAAARSEQALSAGVSATFAGEMERVTRQLQAGEIKATRFAAAITSGLSRASAAISKGVTGQLTVLDKQLQTGTISAEQFMQKLGETAGAGADRAMTTFEASIGAAASALDDGAITADQFTESIIELSATAAGGGVERLQSQIDSISTAMSKGFLKAEEFTGSITDLYDVAAAASLETQMEAIGSAQDAFNSGKISVEQFQKAVNAANAAFRIESIAGYEAAALALADSMKKGKISEEQFEESLAKLNETLDAVVMAPLREGLVAVEEQFGAVSEEAAQFTAQLETTQAAVDKVKLNISKEAKGKGENPFEGIVSGMEKIGGVAKIVGVEVPPVFDEVALSLAGVDGIAKSVSGAIGVLGPKFAAAAGKIGLVIGIAAAVGTALYKVAEYFGLIEEAQALYAQKSLKAWQEEKRKIEERNEALATGAKFQQQFGGRANEIRAEMEQVRVAMGYGGSMSQESGQLALEELNKQLEMVDPKLRRMNEASREFASTMKAASKAASDVLNDQSVAAYRRYKKDYTALMAAAGTMPEIEFKAKVEGLAEEFDREMAKAKALQNIGEEIARIAEDARGKNTARALNKTFAGYGEAMDNRAVNTADYRLARIQGIKGLASGLGLDMKAPELEGIALYTKRLTELNAVVTETAAEEELLAQARGKALQELVDARNKYLEGLPGSNESTGTNAERAILKLDEDMQKLKEARAFVNSPDAALSNQDRLVAMAAIAGREKNLMAEFMRQNESVVDMAAAGKEPARRANTAALASTGDGMAAYFRILRGGDPVTAKQLREAKESKDILKKIEENTAKARNAGLAAANL